MIQRLRPTFKRSRRKTPSGPQPGRGQRLALLGLAVVGLAISVYLTFLHGKLAEDPAWSGACSIRPGLDCEPVLLSRYASIAGAPVAAYGAWFYAVVILIAAANLQRRKGALLRSPPLVLLLASVLATLVSLVLAVVSTFVVGSLCPLCAAVYAINLALLVLAWIDVRRTGESLAAALAGERQHWRRRVSQTTRFLVVLLVTLLVIPLVYSFTPEGESPLCAAIEAGGGTGKATLISMVVYSDFQCPFCRELDQQLRGLRGRSTVEVVHRQYPLDKACNPWVSRTRHPGACLQARAAMCAGRQGRYDDFSDQLFERGSIGREELIGLATLLGLDRDAFTACLASPESEAWLAEDVRAAASQGVRGTPTTFVVGVRRVGPLRRSELQCIETDSPGDAAGSLLTQ